MAKFEPILLANVEKTDSHTLAVYEANGGYQALRKVLRNDPGRRGRNGQEQQPARPRRGRLSHRAEMVLPAQGPSRPDLHVHQCRRERAGHVQQSHPDGRRSAPGDRGDHPQLLRHQGQDGLHLSALRISAVATSGCRPPSTSATPTGYLGKNILGKRLLARHLSASRRRGLHLRRRDRPDRKPGRQAGLAADQAAVSGRRRRVSQADGGQQHRNRGLRRADHQPRRRLVQIDRRAVRSQESPRSGQLRPEAVLPQRARQQARLLRSAAGHHLPAVDRRIWRRRLERAQGQGGHSRRHQHGPADRSRVRHAARFRRAGQGRAAWAWARRPWWCIDETVSHGRFPAQQLPVLRPRKLRPVHALPRRDGLVADDARTASRPARAG